MELRVAFLDVFHGDCAVVTFEEEGGPACIVIDGGKQKGAAKRLATYLKHEGVEVIDLLVATHIDSDHVAGLIYLLRDESAATASWNKGRKKCIRHYWGPMPDPGWTEPKSIRAVGLGRSISSVRRPLEFVIKSVKENQELNRLVEEHIIDTNDIRYPSLSAPPDLDLFGAVELTLMAPDSQIKDSQLARKAMLVSNAPYMRQMAMAGPALRRHHLTLKHMKRIVATNAKEIATIGNRTANNQSIVMKLTPKAASAKARRWTFLFTGDAEHDSWEMMRHTGEVMKRLRSRVLKVPHHGSKNGIDHKSVMAIKPEYSIISVGPGHDLPHGETLTLIRGSDSRNLFCTERGLSKSSTCRNLTGCGMASEKDFRSVRFAIDLDTGQYEIQTFSFGKKHRNIKTWEPVTWCPESQWPV